jgi:hypothetical protein
MTIMIMIPRVKGFRTSQDLAGTLNQRNRGPNQKRTKKREFFSFVVASDFSIFYST